MSRFFLLVICCFSAASVSHVAGAEDETPFQYRSPEQFWSGKLVSQKKGIVIEDQDYIIRKRYWVLDRTLAGKVIGVERGDKKKVFLTVRFDSSGGRWQENGVNQQNRQRTETKRTKVVRPDSYGDGYSVDEDIVSFSYDIQGDEVEPERCGLVVRQEGDTAEVRFPSHLVTLASLEVGDTVMRAADWHDGYADGGDSPTGAISGDARDHGCVGRVEAKRDEHGNVKVKWEKTGRVKMHRFDHQGYYDVQKIDFVIRP